MISHVLAYWLLSLICWEGKLGILGFDLCSVYIEKKYIFPKNNAIRPPSVPSTIYRDISCFIESKISWYMAIWKPSKNSIISNFCLDSHSPHAESALFLSVSPSLKQVSPFRPSSLSLPFPSLPSIGLAVFLSISRPWDFISGVSWAHSSPLSISPVRHKSPLLRSTRR